MGKYAYVKLSIILYHKLSDLSIGFMNFIEIFSEIVWQVAKVQKERRYRGVIITL